MPPETQRGDPARVWSGVVLSLVLTWTFLLGCTPLFNMDIWWHLRTGQLIWEEGRLPVTDWYTVLDADRTWVDLQWGFQLLAAALYRLGGVAWLVLLKAACLTAAVAAAWFASGRQLPAWIKAACWILPVLVLTGRGVVRPEMFTLLFLAVWLWVLARIESRPRLLWILPAVQVLWVNVHALFVLGLVAGGCYAVDRLARRAGRGWPALPPPAHRPGPRALGAAAALVLLASLAGPYLLEGALFPLELYRKLSVDQEFYGARIAEFRPPLDFIRQQGLGDLSLRALLGTAIATGASIVLLGLRRQVRLMHLLLFLSFAFLTWKMSRNMAVFAVVAGVALCANLAALLGPEQHAVGRRPAPSVAMAAVLGVLIVLRFTPAWVALGGEFRRFGLGEREAWYAHGASRFAGQTGMPDRAFVAHLGQAAVYIFHNGPGRKVFMDGRLEVCSRRTFETYEAVRGMMVRRDRRWMELLRDGQGRLPAIILDSRLSRAEIGAVGDLPDWRLVYADAAAAVLLHEPLADRLGLPAADVGPLINPP